MLRLGLALLVVVGAIAWLRSGTMKAAAGRSAPGASAPLLAAPAPSSAPRTLPVASALPQARSAMPAGERPTAVDLSATDWRKLPLAGAPTLSDGWPGWRCADIDDGSTRSLWVRDDAPEEAHEIYEGTCSEWANRGPGGMPSDGDAYGNDGRGDYDLGFPEYPEGQGA